MINITVKPINLTEHFEQLLAIWRACFPEDADFGTAFLKEVAPTTTVFGMLVNNTLVSCAYCLPTSLCDNKIQLSAYYVYGVGTLPSHRGKGYAKKMLAHIKDTLCADVLFLYPAKPSLRDFYTALGYRSLLCRTEVSIAPTVSKPLPSFRVEPFDITMYEEKRTAFLENTSVLYATFGSVAMQTLLGHALLLLADTITAVCIVEDDMVIISEALCDAEQMPLLVTIAKQAFPQKNVVVYTTGTDKVSGMVLPLSDVAERYFDTQEVVPFFGTFFAE